MHAVTNHLPIKSGADWAELGRRFDSFHASIAHPNFLGAGLIRVSETETSPIGRDHAHTYWPINPASSCSRMWQ